MRLAAHSSRPVLDTKAGPWAWTARARGSRTPCLRRKWSSPWKWDGAGKRPSSLWAEKKGGVVKVPTSRVYSRVTCTHALCTRRPHLGVPAPGGQVAPQPHKGSTARAHGVGVSEGSRAWFNPTRESGSSAVRVWGGRCGQSLGHPSPLWLSQPPGSRAAAGSGCPPFRGVAPTHVPAASLRSDALVPVHRAGLVWFSW